MLSLPAMQADKNGFDAFKNKMKKMKNPVLPFLFAALIVASSCKKTQEETTQQPPAVNAIAPDGFNFTTSKNVTVNVQLLTNDNKPLSGVEVNFYSPDNAGESMSL